MNTHTLKAGIANLLLTLAMTACGGGGGSSDPPTAATPAAPQPPTTSGIEGTGRRIASVGSITQFGSIFVNGIEYSTDRATIQVEGRSVTQAGLALGQVVTVVGTLNANGTTAIADTVTFSAPLVGAVQSIDIAQATLTILGQRVRVDGATRFSSDITPASLQGIAVGSELQVSGFRDSRGVLTARSIERRAAGQSLAATGDASAVDAAAQRLSIGSLVVSYASATLEGFGGRQPQSGDHVRAEAASLSSGGTLQATRLARVDRRLPAQTGNTGHLQGWVTRFSSVTDFDVDGIRITTDSATLFNSAQPGGFGGLRLDRFVNVIGVLLADGRLLATDIRTNNNFAINATVFSSGPFSIEYGQQGRRCETAATTYSVDGRSANWSDVHPGDVITVAESFSSNEPPRCNIVTLNRAVRGPVESIDAARGRLIVMGQSVHTTGKTLIRNVGGLRSIDALAAVQPGEIVEISGYRSSTGQLVATRVGGAEPTATNLVTGAVASLDLAARRFTIGALPIDYSAATPASFPNAAPANGQRVIVRGGLQSGVLRATELEYDVPNPRGSTNGPAHIFGPITALRSAADFEIEGRRIVPAPASGTSQFPADACTEELIDLNAYVLAITASQPVAGIDFARVVLFHAGGNFPAFAGDAVRLTARVDSVDSTQRQLQLAGFESVVQPLTRLRQGSTGGAVCGRPLPLDEVRSGDTVSVTGLPGPNGYSLIADSVHRASPVASPLLEIQGATSNYDPTEMRVAGLRLRLSAATRFSNCTADGESSDLLFAAEFGALMQRELAVADAAPQISAIADAAGGLDLLDARQVNACLPYDAQTGTVRARVESVDAAARRISVLGQSLPIDDAAFFEDRSVTPSVSVQPSQLAAGQFVELSVRWRPLAPILNVTGISIMDRAGTGVARLSGRPDAWQEPELQVFGRTVRTDAATVFVRDSQTTTAREFFADRFASYEVEVVLDAGGILRATRVAVQTE